jgi:hypothetical protein
MIQRSSASHFVALPLRIRPRSFMDNSLPTMMAHIRHVLGQFRERATSVNATASERSRPRGGRYAWGEEQRL